MVAEDIGEEDEEERRLGSLRLSRLPIVPWVDCIRTYGIVRYTTTQFVSSTICTRRVLLEAHQSTMTFLLSLLLYRLLLVRLFTS